MKIKIIYKKDKSPKVPYQFLCRWGEFDDEFKLVNEECATHFDDALDCFNFLNQCMFEATIVGMVRSGKDIDEISSIELIEE